MRPAQMICENAALDSCNHNMNSMEDYERAIALIAQADAGDFEGPKTELLIAQVEAVLGLQFPPTYRRFLRDVGCGNIAGVEVYGLINENFDDSSVPNGIWLTLELRRAIGLDPTYVLIGDGGDGTLHAIDTGKADASGECPVVRLSVDGCFCESLATNFGEYLLDALTAVLR